jgi:aquaporin Z
VSLGLAIGGRLPWGDLVPYWVAQVVGGTIGALVLYVVASGQAGWMPGGFASNGYGELSPGGYSLLAGFVIELVLTAGFIFVILGATAVAAPAGFAGVAIGLCLTLIHLVSIPVTNTSVNPARSTAVAFFAETGAMSQLWLFWVAPLAGAALGALVWKSLLAGED